MNSISCENLDVNKNCADSYWYGSPQKKILQEKTLEMVLAGVILGVLFASVNLSYPSPFFFVLTLVVGFIYYRVAWRLFSHVKKYKTATYVVRGDELLVVKSSGEIVGSVNADASTSLRLVVAKQYISLEWLNELRSRKGGVMRYSEGFLYMKNDDQIIKDILSCFPGKISIEAR